MIDASVMSRDALRKFLARLNKASEEDVLFSLHMKATMMKVSDPIIFGHCVEAYLGEIIDEYGEILIANGFNRTTDLLAYQALDALDQEIKIRIQNSLQKIIESRPPLAMVNSDKGITNLHVPSDVIIDASMPARSVHQVKCGDQMANRKYKSRDS